MQYFGGYKSFSNFKAFQGLQSTIFDAFFSHVPSALCSLQIMMSLSDRYDFFSFLVYFNSSQNMFQFTSSSRVCQFLDVHFSLILTPLKPACFLTLSLNCMIILLGGFPLPLLVEHEIVMHLNIAWSQSELWYSTVPKAFWGLQSIFQFMRSSGMLMKHFPVSRGLGAYSLFPRGRSLGVLESYQVLLLHPSGAPEPRLPGSSIRSLSLCMGHTPVVGPRLWCPFSVPPVSGLGYNVRTSWAPIPLC